MKYLFTVFGCLLMIYGCGGNEQEPTAVQDIPVLPVDTLQVTLEIGVELGDSTNTFGAITSTLIDQRGRILVLDQVASCVKIFDRSGKSRSHPAGLETASLASYPVYDCGQQPCAAGYEYHDSYTALQNH